MRGSTATSSTVIATPTVTRPSTAGGSRLRRSATPSTSPCKPSSAASTGSHRLRKSSTSTAKNTGHLSLFFAAEEKAVGGVCGFIPIGVAERCGVLGEACAVGGRNLHAGEHSAVVRAVIAVVEEADVPAVADRAQEREQRARTLRKLEPVE